MGSPVCIPCQYYLCDNCHGEAPDPNFRGMAPCSCSHEEKRTRTEDEIAECVGQVKAEILDDIAKDIQPATVSTFSQLHDSVDANEYGGLCDPEQRGDWTVGDIVVMQDAVDAWLKAGRPEGKT